MYRKFPRKTLVSFMVYTFFLHLVSLDELKRYLIYYSYLYFTFETIFFILDEIHM